MVPIDAAAEHAAAADSAAATGAARLDTPENDTALQPSPTGDTAAATAVPFGLAVTACSIEPTEAPYNSPFTLTVRFDVSAAVSSAGWQVRPPPTQSVMLGVICNLHPKRTEAIHLECGGRLHGGC